MQNWVLAADSVDYLASDVDPAAAQHYWSLSIEEQFYLVWPLLILAAAVWARAALLVADRGDLVGDRRCRRRHRWSSRSGSPQANPPAAYFVTPARAWQFGAGGLLGLWFATRSSHRPRRAQPSAGWRLAVPILASWGGFAALAWCGLTYDETTPFPGTAAIVPVVGHPGDHRRGRAARQAVARPRCMRSRPVRFFGDISYSLYLWHWPPIVILPVVLGHSMGFSARVLVLVGAILAAAATKKWVEDPVRFTRRPALRRPLTALVATAAGAAVIVAGARVGVGTAVAVERTQQAAVAAVLKDAPDCFGAACDGPAAALLQPRPRRHDDPGAGGRRARLTRTTPAALTGITGTSSTTAPSVRSTTPTIPHVVLLGDSHALMLLPAARGARRRRARSRSQRSIKGSCAWTRDPINHWNEARVDSCQKWKAKLEPWLVEQAPTTDLILTTGYARFNSGTPARAGRRACRRRGSRSRSSGVPDRRRA